MTDSIFLIDAGPVARPADELSEVSTPTIIEDRRRGWIGRGAAEVGNTVGKFSNSLMIASADGVTRIGTEMRPLFVIGP